MNTTFTMPSADAVRAACKHFADDSNDPDAALFDLFARYPDNTNQAHVLLKVVTLNSLYSLLIRVNSQYLPTDRKYAPTVYDVARHIVELKIDAALSRADEALIDRIATVKVAGRNHYYYSFATKYCSFHRPESYPIFDSRVKEYLWQLRNQGGLRQFQQQVLWNYPELKRIIDEMRDQYSLQGFSYKQIDAFLYLEGGKLLTAKEAAKEKKQPAA
jgi:hypothetical protein